MKKGEKAKLDVNWWKKNKSMRLRSKAFDTALSDYITARDRAERAGDDPDLWREASNLALGAKKEASQLVGKCGLKQDETKAVLQDYVKLLDTLGKDANKQHLAHLKSATKAQDRIAQAFSRHERALRTDAERLGKLEKLVAQMDATAGKLIAAIGAKQFAINVNTVTGKADEIENSIEDTADALTTAAKTGQVGSTPPGQVDKAIKAANELRQRAHRMQVEVSGLRLKSRDALAAEAA
ncbi:hypothetical protein LNKW23_22470 [Paralimibaculum aggregatum]|uniref:PspA/IM30 family protein n=1 Tax=Paralimibaculum aggregatum TaxID=3036245 RepID=A0ABQ6LL74_9RHOB|nr:hypothetical protein [Limibaculum sp. NKW23]GMG83034.1 hypothetical protein LNKW23_22470 [Limibaculum sp. NKW23]